jgi:polysaccharide pyruvyl transferase WcaK-like protein
MFKGYSIFSYYLTLLDYSHNFSKLMNYLYLPSWIHDQQIYTSSFVIIKVKFD